uniref:Uncharacterized protein n=1 Tax=Arundo donax TaxID=35708 RepID=A0A0A9EKB9_ARUDO
MASSSIDALSVLLQ